MTGGGARFCRSLPAWRISTPSPRCCWMKGIRSVGGFSLIPDEQAPRHPWGRSDRTFGGAAMRAPRAWGDGVGTTWPPAKWLLVWQRRHDCAQPFLEDDGGFAATIKPQVRLDHGLVIRGFAQGCLLASGLAPRVVSLPCSGKVKHSCKHHLLSSRCQSDATNHLQLRDYRAS